MNVEQEIIITLQGLGYTKEFAIQYVSNRNSLKLTQKEILEINQKIADKRVPNFSRPY